MTDTRQNKIQELEQKLSDLERRIGEQGDPISPDSLPESTVVRGKPIDVIDVLGNVLSLPQKVLLLSSRIDSHFISKRTEDLIHQFINHHNLRGVKIRLNQYAPHDEFTRLFSASRVHRLLRIPMGILTWIGYLLNPGRVFGGDFYNPFSNSVNIFSDHVAIVLHELGHALDFRNRRHPGLYQLMRYLPFVALYQEYVASKYAILFLKERQYYRQEIAAYKILYPAYSTYVFGAIYELLPSPLLAVFYLPLICLAHLAGRIHAFLRSIEIGPLPPEEKESPRAKVDIMLFCSTLVGLTVGYLVWRDWKCIISAVLAYYICFEIKRYLEKPTPPENPPVKRAESQVLERLLDDAKDIYSTYVRHLHELVGLLEGDILEPAIQSVNAILELVEDAKLQLQNGKIQDAQQTWEAVRHQEDQNKGILSDLSQYGSLRTSVELPNLFKRRLFKQICKNLYNHRRWVVKNRLLSIFYTEATSKIEAADQKYEEALRTLKKGQPAIAHRLCLEALDLVADHDRSNRLERKARDQVSRARQLLEKAYNSLTKRDFGRTIRRARRACTLDSSLCEKAEVFIYQSKEGRKRRIIRIAAATASLIFLACASWYTYPYYYPYFVEITSEPEYQRIMALDTEGPHLCVKIVRLRKFMSNYPSYASTRHSVHAGSVLKDLEARLYERRDFQQLEAQRNNLEAAKNYEKLAEVGEDFLKKHVKGIFATEVKEKLTFWQNQADTRDYDVILKDEKDLIGRKDERGLRDLYASYLAKHPNGRHAEEIKKRASEITNQLALLDYERLRAMTGNPIGDKLAIYRRFLEDHGKSSFAPEVRGKMTEETREYYQKTKMGLESLKAKRELDSAIHLCDEFIGIVKDGDYVSIVNDLKNQFVGSKKDFLEFRELQKREMEFGEEYGEAKRMYEEYLLLNPTSENMVAIRDMIRELERQIHFKEELAEIEIPKEPLPIKIKKLQQYLSEKPPERWRSRAIVLRDGLLLKKEEQDRQRKIEEERKWSEAQKRLWSQTHAKASNIYIPITQRIKFLQDYLKDNARSKGYDVLVNQFIEKLVIEEKRISEIEREMLSSFEGMKGIYLVIGDGTVIDKRTGLMWVLLDSYNYLGGRLLDYEGARRYVGSLRTAGYTDWRLPTKEEIEALYKKPPCYPGSGAAWYWTSSVLSTRWVSVVMSECPSTAVNARIEATSRSGSVRAVRNP